MSFRTWLIFLESNPDQKSQTIKNIIGVAQNSKGNAAQSMHQILQKTANNIAQDPEGEVNNAVDIGIALDKVKGTNTPRKMMKKK